MSPEDAMNVVRKKWPSHWLIWKWRLHQYCKWCAPWRRARNLNKEFLGAFAKLLKATVSSVITFRLHARPHGTTRFPLDGFSLNLIFEDFPKIYRENSSFIKIWQDGTCVTWSRMRVM